MPKAKVPVDPPEPEASAEAFVTGELEPLASEPLAPEPVEAPAPEPPTDSGTPCIFQADPQTIRDALAFSIDAESGTAGELHVLTDRFHKFRNVRRSSAPLRLGAPDGVGCYYIEEGSGAGD